MTVSCGSSSATVTLSNVIHIHIDTKAVKGARVYWRIESQTKNVNSTIRFLLGRTPYNETRTLYIPGLTKDNISDVNIVIEIKKRGFYTIVERFNMSSVMSDKRIGKVFTLYKKAHKSYKTPARKKTIKKRMKKTPAKKKTARKKVKKKTPVKEINIKLAIKSPVIPNYKRKYPKPTERPKKKFIPKPKLITAAPVIIKDIYEPNNSTDKAKAVYLNREYLAKMDSKSDLDYYMIFLGAQPKYKLIIDHIASGAKYQIEVMTYPKKIETVYKLITTKEKEELSLSLKDKGKSTGIYCIKVSYLSGKTGAYRLRIKLDR